MLQIEKSIDLPYPPEPLFDLVADIERYPEFVPGYRAVRILVRDGNRMSVEQIVRGGPFHRRLRSEALLERPGRITIHSPPGALPGFTIDWCFEPRGAGCTVRCHATVSAGPLERLAAPWLDHFVRRTLAAFRTRAALVVNREA